MHLGRADVTQKQANECPSSAGFVGPSLHNPVLFKELKTFFRHLFSSIALLYPPQAQGKQILTQDHHCTGMCCLCVLKLSKLK